MKSAIIISFAILVAVIMGACSRSRVSSEVKSLYGREISFDQTFELISGDSVRSTGDILDSDIKIVTYIDSVSCTKCILQSLLLWNQKLEDVQAESVGFVVVIYPNDKAKIKQALSELVVDYPLFYDTNNSFIAANDLNVLARNKTFLLDKNNKIIIVGEPVVNKKLWQLYVSCVKTMRANDGLMP